MTEYADEFTEVLGAYALDAVDADEQTAIEAHLVTCPRCRAEVAEHREVAALLSQSGAAAPEGIWDRIAAELSPEAPPMRMTIAPRAEDPAPPATGADAAGDGAVVAISQARSVRNVRARTLFIAITAAAAIVAVLGVVTVGQSRRLDRMEAAVGDVPMEKLATRAMGSSPIQVHLKGSGVDAQAVVGRDGQGYLVANDLPAPAKGSVYQLWGQVDSTVLSLGTFGQGTTVVPFRVDPSRLKGVQAFAITQEKAPGVIKSEQEPVAAGTV